MQISLCFRIISFFKKANKLWVSTLRVQPNLCKTLHGKHEEELYRSSLWKNTLLYHSSGKGDPASPEKCALFFFFSSERMCTVLCVDFRASGEGRGGHAIPLCRPCSGWGRIALPSLPLTLHWCRTWGFRTLLGHCCFHGLNIPCTVFWVQSCRWEHWLAPC